MKTIYTSNNNDRLGKVTVIERTETRYQKQSNAGFWLFLAALVGAGAWAASVIF